MPLMPLMPLMPHRVLTDITTTGSLHLGNYVGSLRRAVAASREPGVEAFYFIADYHALIKCDDPDRVERSRLVDCFWAGQSVLPASAALSSNSNPRDTLPAPRAARS